jgi:hypothetical protein
MGIIAPKSLSRCEEQRDPNQFFDSDELFSFPVNSKINQLALGKIALRRNLIPRSRLVATTSQSLMEILPDIFGSKTTKKKTLFYHANLLPAKKEYPIKEEILPPIGIFGEEGCSWMIALMQFSIFIPSIRAMFDYVPPSFSQFMRFVDLYRLDQEKNKSVTGARTEPLIDGLLERFPIDCFLRGKEIDLGLVLKKMMEFFLPPREMSRTSNLLAYRPEWQLDANSRSVSKYASLDAFMHDELLIRDLPAELLISFSHIFEKKAEEVLAKEHLKSYYLFSKESLSISYELTSFIEYRRDAFSQSDGYVAYVKVGNGWYQCMNERVVLVRSNHLSVPLERGLLFYYRRQRMQS